MVNVLQELGIKDYVSQNNVLSHSVKDILSHSEKIYFSLSPKYGIFYHVLLLLIRDFAKDILSLFLDFTDIFTTALMSQGLTLSTAHS